MPYLIIALVLVVAGAAVFFLRKKKTADAAPAPENFVPIVHSEGGGTYASDSTGGITLIGEAGIFPLGTKGGTIGSSPQSAARLTGNGVAPSHAEITREGNKFVLRALHGATVLHNGTQTGETPLDGGDTLAFGAVTLRVQLT